MTPEEIETGGENVFVSDKSGGNHITNMPENISKNSKGDEKSYLDKEGDEIVTSCKILFLSHNDIDFDSWLVLNLLENEIRDFKFIRTARRMKM